MQVTTRASQVVTEGEIESATMTISKKGIAKATAMFRDKIYQYKDWAVIREIISNAVDEHNKHGVKTPVKVTLPSEADPFFRVRDFGKGLSKKAVFSIFFQYFESTKSDSNDEIGGFGIGAKSPLAYSDIFFVDSFFEGEKTTYAANLHGEASVAQKMNLATVDKNETGIEVSIPVKKEDFARFASLVNYLATFGKFNLEIEGEREKLDFGIKGISEFGFLVNEEGSLPFKADQGIYASIKGILYPLGDHGIVNPAKYPIVLLFDGTEGLQIQPSREALEVTASNTFILKNKMEDYMTNYKKERDALISSCKNATEFFEVKRTALKFKENYDASNGAFAGLLARSSEVIHLSWSEHTFQKKRMKDVLSRYWHGRNTIYHFDPSGEVSNRGRKGKVVFFEGRTTPLYYLLIAYAEKMGVTDGIFAINKEIPKGWVEGEDYLFYKKGSLDKDEIKKVKSRYIAPTNSQGKGSISGRVVMGHSRQNSASGHSCTYEELKKCEVKIVAVKIRECKDISSLIGMANHMQQKIRFVFVYDSSLRLWKKCDLNFEWFSRKKFTKMMNDLYTRNHNLLPFLPSKLPEVIKARVRGGRSLLFQKNLQRIEGYLPYFKKNEDAKAIKKTKGAIARYSKLSDFNRELLDSDHKIRYASKAIKARVNQIKEKVFGSGS